ncbi:hypothetical protein RP20_CCG027287 [Aedes albopictus]|nr:hypothetical protein RP20_CCG027287 [Aedes albopictus]
MAEENSFRELVLRDLQLPGEILTVFEGADIDSLRLSRISRDELQAVLGSGPLDIWNIDEIFRRILVWRQESGFGIIGFEDVEIVEDWLICESPEESEENTSRKENEPANDTDSTETSEVLGTQNRTIKVLPQNNVDSVPSPPSSPIAIQPNISEVKPGEPTTTVAGQIKATATPATDLFNLPPGTSKAAVACMHSSACTGKENRNFTPNVLVELLERTVIGRQLLERAAVRPLTSESQRELVDIIAEHHCVSGAKATEVVLREYTEAITTVFKHETQDTYLVIKGGTKRNPGGKIFNRITNRKQKAAKRKRIEEKHEAEIENRAGEQVAEHKIVKEAETWLEYNCQPWSTTLDKWKVVFPGRKPLLMKPNAVEEVLKRYRHYSEEFGFQLVESDFEQLAVGDINGSRTWKLCLEKLIRYVKRPYKDQLSKDIVDQLASGKLNDDSKVCAVLILLNNFLLPTKVTKTFKPTILSAQEDVIFFAATDAEAMQKIHEFNETSCKLGLKPSPKLIFKGENFKSLTGEFEVHYQQIVYRFNSAVRAVDVLIKFSTVFGLEYSKISRLVWNFVSSYMYKIPVPEEYQSIIKLKRYLTVD